MRRAGRKISAYKKQHPNFEASEEESKAVADLELDLLYIKVSGLEREEEDLWIEFQMGSNTQATLLILVASHFEYARNIWISISPNTRSIFQSTQSHL